MKLPRISSPRHNYSKREFLYTVKELPKTGKGKTLYYIAQGTKMVSRPSHDRDGLAVRVDNLNATLSHKELPCITCKQPFISEGPHNRMCDLCRNKTTGFI